MALQPTSKSTATASPRTIIIGSLGQGGTNGFGAADGQILYTVPPGKTCIGTLSGLPPSSYDSGHLAVKISVGDNIYIFVTLATKVSSQQAATVGPIPITLTEGSSLIATGNTNSAGGYLGTGAQFIGVES